MGSSDARSVMDESADGLCEVSSDERRASSVKGERRGRCVRSESRCASTVWARGGLSDVSRVVASVGSHWSLRPTWTAGVRVRGTFSTSVSTRSTCARCPAGPRVSAGPRPA